MSRSVAAVRSYDAHTGSSPLALLARGLTWLAAAAVLAVPFLSPGSPVSLVQVALEKSAQLTISGSVEGLRHDLPAALALTLSSGSDTAVVVRSLTARVTGASAGCPANALSIGSWTGRLVVPAHGHAAADVPVRLRDVGSKCTGATWQLSYTSA